MLNNHLYKSQAFIVYCDYMDDMDIVENELKKIDEMKRSTSKKGILMEVCPICGEPELTYYRMVAGGIIPLPVADQKYLCKNCGYIGSVSLEVETEEDIRKIKDHYEMIKKSETMNHKSLSSQKNPEVMTPEYSWLWKDVLVIVLFIVVSNILILIAGKAHFTGIPYFTIVQSAAIVGLIAGSIIYFIHRTISGNKN